MDEDALNLLTELVKKLESVVVADLSTYLGYKEAHDHDRQTWWNNQITLSKTFDWSQFVTQQLRKRLGDTNNLIT